MFSYCFVLNLYLLALQVKFECDIPNGRWSQSVTNLDTKDRMVSFKTPFFPYQVDKAKSVDVKLEQTSRVLGTINYFYISSRNFRK
jgi:hypothetical protein